MMNKKIQEQVEKDLQVWYHKKNGEVTTKECFSEAISRTIELMEKELQANKEISFAFGQTEGITQAKADFKKMIEDSREELSNLEHEQWGAWSKEISRSEKISSKRLKRWKELWKPYSELDEKTKDSDRIWADKIINFLLAKLGDKK